VRVSNLRLLALILLLTAGALWADWPQEPANYLPGFIPWPKNQGIHLALGGWSFDRQGTRLGLDLQGGINLVYEADLSAVSASERADALEGVVKILDRRINAFGVTEPSIQKLGANRVMVQLPGITEVQTAKELIGRTAKLEFKEQIIKDGKMEWVVAKAIGSDGTEKALTGKYFKPNAQVVFSSDPGQQGRPQVAFELHGDGPKLFEQITTRLVGKPLGIFLDDELISDPIVQAVLRDRGVITFSTLTPAAQVLEESKTLAIQLNAGALPVPISIVQEQAVDATLGSDSIKKSILAGEVGLGIVLLFMVTYYRLPGFLASCALVIYALLVLAIFKLWPVTLTLAGIAAFILSIGMAVDASILIFERMREEFRAGRTFGASIEAGFARAWTSIRDSNVSTMITCVILFWFGSNFGASMVTGFAVTLFIGVVLSMFTAIVVTRTFLRLFIGSRWARNLALFGITDVKRPPG